MKKSWLYNGAAFLAAFLLFQIQPISSKALLPLFGGSYLVWGSCMVFFQVMLLLGYLYAHLLQRWFGVHTYARFHWLLLSVPLTVFPFDFSSMSVHVRELPLALSVFRFLFVSVGLPALVLSTASPILQRWLSVSTLSQRKNPYALYAASNLGSMLALLTYPVLVEPYFDIKMQGFIWWGAYLIYILLHLACFPVGGNHEDGKVSVSTGRLGAEAVLKWLFLSSAPCFLLLAVTNVLTFDVASVPFLWVLPLSVYLLAFVLAFKRNPWYPGWLENVLPWSIIFGMVIHMAAQLRLGLPVQFAVAAHLLILFAVCLSCASGLAGSKPADAGHLTTFYLVIAAGGLAGSLLVSWIIPVASRSLVEYPIAFVLAATALALGAPGGVERNVRGLARTLPRALLQSAVVVLVVTLIPWWAGHSAPAGGLNTGVLFILVSVPLALILRSSSVNPLGFCMVLLAATIAMSWTEDLLAGAARVKNLRNYYGIYKVFDAGNLRYLKHGTTQHGRQYLSGPERETPLSYYHPSTPAAGILRSGKFRFRRIGMIGLGTGALAVYAGAGQEFIIYELDPDNLEVARDYFTYLEIAERRGASLKYVFGDGRISLGREKPASLDLLILDAFNSGAIPVHLLTVEAFESYLRAVGREGLVLLHVSNQVLDLLPVVRSNARFIDAAVCEKNNAGLLEPGADETYWMALTRNRVSYGILTGEMGWEKSDCRQKGLPSPWTDQTCDILRAVLWKGRK
jgi:hypothetical protein